MDKNTKKFAVINLMGSQQLVSEGVKVAVNRMKNEVGESISTQDLINDEKVNLKVIEHKKGEKVVGLKFKNKVRYLKRYGHRQLLTVLEVASIGDKKVVTEKKEEKSVKTETKKPAKTTKAVKETKTTKKAKK